MLTNNNTSYREYLLKFQRLFEQNWTNNYSNNKFNIAWHVVSVEKIILARK